MNKPHQLINLLKSDGNVIQILVDIDTEVLPDAAMAIGSYMGLGP